MRTAKVLLLTYYAYMIEYRAELFLWALSGVLPLILMGVWIEAAQGGRFALSPVIFARYFMAAFIVRQLNTVWVIWEFEKDVLEGKLSPRLLQPLDPVWHHVASHLAERAGQIPFLSALVMLFFTLYPEAFWLPSLQQFGLFWLATILAFILRFIIQYTFALFAFWLERATAIEQFWYLLYLFLSGLIAPLEMFPESVRQVAMWTPFPYVIHFPVALLIGLPVDVGRGFLMMIGWCGIFFIWNRWLWRRGLKRYSAMGA